MSDDTTESVATHSSRLQPSIICMPQLPPWCQLETINLVVKLIQIQLKMYAKAMK